MEEEEPSRRRKVPPQHHKLARGVGARENADAQGEGFVETRFAEIRGGELGGTKLRAAGGKMNGISPLCRRDHRRRTVDRDDATIGQPVANHRHRDPMAATDFQDLLGRSRR